MSEPAIFPRIVKSLRPLENVASCQNAIDGAMAAVRPVRSPLSLHPGGRICCGLRAEDVKLCALVAASDGALGFWAAPDQAHPHTRHRRCRFHKAGSILNVLPKSVLPRAKQALQQIWMA